MKNLDKAYELAKEQYSEFGVDCDAALDKLGRIQLSLHCWQADDVGGFEKSGAALSGGIRATGNYPGKARNIDELRRGIEKAMSLMPGRQRLNLHAIYGDFGEKKVDRDEITTAHFQSWIDWAGSGGFALDFNCTCFSHPKAADGFTLSSKDPAVRNFWIEHVNRCREIGAEMGRQQNDPCVHNIWIPDGSKDTTVERFTHRSLLKDSLDRIFSVKYPSEILRDSVESKLFGIGLEYMTVGSHDFYLPYAAQNNLMICLDSGHFHPTEQTGDKISACLLFVPGIMMHITRPIRWDSDHVVTLSDDVLLITQEVVRADAVNRVRFGLDFFDASINRIGAYVIGARAFQQAMLISLLEPVGRLRELEDKGRLFDRLALLELMKTMPFGIVWDYFCMRENVPVGKDFIASVNEYETEVLAKRD